MGHRQSLSNSTNQTQDSSLKEKNVYIAEECYSLMSSNSIKSIQCEIEETASLMVRDHQMPANGDMVTPLAQKRTTGASTGLAFELATPPLRNIVTPCTTRLDPSGNEVGYTLGCQYELSDSSEPCTPIDQTIQCVTPGAPKPPSLLDLPVSYCALRGYEEVEVMIHGGTLTGSLAALSEFGVECDSLSAASSLSSSPYLGFLGESPAA